MHRFYLPPAQCHDSALTLTGQEAHHGLRVLRLRPGERLALLHGIGHGYLCETRELTRCAIELAVKQKTFLPRLPCQVTLLQAIPKGKMMDIIVQKAAELGATRVVPLLSDRVVAHLDEEASKDKTDKWRLVAIESIKQCGSAWLPEIDAPITPKTYLTRGEKFDLALIASLQPGSRHPREVFRDFSEIGRA